MSSDIRAEFNKNNIDEYLKELAKTYRKIAGKNMPAELILIGGASVLINYGFRNMTTDIDAIISAASGMKDALNIVRDKYNLPVGWLNNDFQKTSSYTPRLMRVSKYYKTYSNVLTIRTISSEYLVAMKLMSGRPYKNDLSDIVGILYEHERLGNPITLDLVKKATEELYDSWKNISEQSRTFITDIFESNDLQSLYDKVCRDEKETKKDLIAFQQDYPGVMNEDNVNDIAGNLSVARDKDSILAKLREKKSHGK